MSYFDHMHDSKGVKEECGECGKTFKWVEEGPFYPGGKDTEFIICPYCKARNGSIRTSGFVITSKVEQ